MYTTIEKSFPAVRTISKQLRWPRSFIASALILSCIAFSQLAQAVSPPPGGGYAGFNTALGTDALFSLTSGAYNTAIGWSALYMDTTGSQNTATGFEALVQQHRQQQHG